MLSELSWLSELSTVSDFLSDVVKVGITDVSFKTDNQHTLWSDNMNMTLVKYRTTDVAYNQYAVIPTYWLSDLLEWLTLSESAEIVLTDNGCRSSPILPINWPSYQTCSDSIHISDLLSVAR